MLGAQHGEDLALKIVANRFVAEILDLLPDGVSVAPYLGAVSPALRENERDEPLAAGSDH